MIAPLMAATIFRRSFAVVFGIRKRLHRGTSSKRRTIPKTSGANDSNRAEDSWPYSADGGAEDEER